jgi:hypothetical protein
MDDPPRTLRASLDSVVLMELGGQAPDNEQRPDGSWLPRSLPDPTYFALNGYVFLGTEGWSDSFSCLVCSPRWLADHFDDLVDWFSAEEPVKLGEARPRQDGLPRTRYGSSMILMSEWSEEALAAHIDELCEKCVGPDWATVASRLSRYVDWEWEYRYDEYVDAHPERFRLPEGWTMRAWK